MLLSVLLSIAFFTLLERKLIGYMQSRKGPNKTLTMGLFQPIADAIKLLSKEANLNSKSNFVEFMITPNLNIICSLVMWMTIPMIHEFGFMKMGMLFMLSCMSLNTIIVMKMSWSSNSNYAYIGMMRSVAQMISYEINFIMVMMIIISLMESLSLTTILEPPVPLIWTTFPLILAWFLTILAETNRTPFDFAEGESELISGFNVEYGGPSFMMLFLAEYSSILFMSILTVYLFTSLKGATIMFYTLYLAICVAFIWIRATMPRFRYDKLMKINWTQILPVTTLIMFASFPAKIY